MNKKEAAALYSKIKSNATKYEEEMHCTLALRIFSDSHGSVAEFCKEAVISDGTFYAWIGRHKQFCECYRVGAMIGRYDWEQEGKNSRDNPEFNMDYWKSHGAMRYGLGKTNRVRVDIDADANPYDQYRQLMRQAAHGDFTAGEVKQLMEGINVGRTVYETFKMQTEIDKMKQDVLKMSQNSGNNIIPIEKSAKAN